MFKINHPFHACNNINYFEPLLYLFSCCDLAFSSCNSAFFFSSFPSNALPRICCGAPRMDIKSLSAWKPSSKLTVLLILAIAIRATSLSLYRDFAFSFPSNASPRICCWDLMITSTSSFFNIAVRRILLSSIFYVPIILVENL